MTLKIDIEYTDTCCGQAKYSWVRRATLELPDGLTDASIMRQAKKSMGIDCLRGRTNAYGDCWEFMPQDHATVMFVAVSD